MTKGICDTLGLPHLEDILDDKKAAEATADLEGAVPPEAMDAIDRAEEAIANTVELSDGQDHGEALDDLHAETLKHSQDLMDLGFNVDVRSARGIFEVAASMFKNAIDSKNSKRDAQLKLMKLMLDKRKLDLEEAKMRGASGGSVISGDGVIIEDRNALIERLRNANRSS